MVYLQILLNQLIIIPIYIVPIMVRYCITVTRNMAKQEESAKMDKEKKKNA